MPFLAVELPGGSIAALVSAVAAACVLIYRAWKKQRRLDGTAKVKGDLLVQAVTFRDEQIKILNKQITTLRDKSDGLTRLIDRRATEHADTVERLMNHTIDKIEEWGERDIVEREKFRATVAEIRQTLADLAAEIRRMS